MQGALGIGSNLNKFSEADFTLAKKMISLDKKIRGTVQTGDLYRLLSPRESDVTANQYVAIDGHESILFAFRHSQQYYCQRLSPHFLKMKNWDYLSHFQKK